MTTLEHDLLASFDPHKADLSWVLPGRLAVGGDLQANHVQARSQGADLVALGVTHVLDLRSEEDDRHRMEVFAPGVIYRHIPRHDDGKEIGGFWWQRVLDWCSQVLQDPDAVLFVHCHMGVNRAPSVVFMLLVVVYELDPLDAYRLLREVRPYAYASYAPHVLHWLGRQDEVPALIELVQSYGSVRSINRVINSIHQLKGVYD